MEMSVLTRYKIKLSVWYALSVLGVFVILAGVYCVTEGLLGYYQLQASLKNRMTGVENILWNKTFYLDQIDEGNTILSKILLRTLDNSLIIENSKYSYSFFSPPVSQIPSENGFQMFGGDLYLRQSFHFQTSNYSVILRAVFVNHPYAQFQKFLYSVLVSLPFFLILWWLGYLMVSKNFRVIEESIEALEDFTSHVNHELNTPLTEIISTLWLAQKTKKYPEAIDEALLSSKRLASMLKAIVTLSSIGNLSYQKEKLLVHHELENFLKQSSQKLDQKRMVLEKKIEWTSFFLRTNRENLMIVFWNLLSNAVKYSPEWWKILIEFKWGIFSITDWGKWIDRENLDNIFKRYFREDYVSQDGFWIGLALVKKIIDANGWSIEIHSEKWVGTSVSVDFNKQQRKGNKNIL